MKGFRRAVPIIIGALALLIAVFLLTKGAGALGGGIKALFMGALSFGAYAIPLVMIAHALFYASDIECGKLKSRVGFSVTAVLCVSVIEFAISVGGGEAVFAPAKFFADRVGGGFFGNLIGFPLVKLFGSIGAVIVCAAVLAVYTTFFFADKMGAYGRGAKAFASKLASLLTRVDDKIKDKNEKNRIIKEEQDQLQREVASEELADDEFFKPHGAPGDIKVKSLGIDEESSPSGVSPLMDNKDIFVDEPEIIEQPAEKRHREKPLDLSYGMETEPFNDTPITDGGNEAPASNANPFGLDDSPENVFTKDFDPFNFATSEKIASKPSSKATPIEEELDDLTLYEMKANHVPTERERRMAELERRKKEWLAKKNEGKPEAEATSAVNSTPAEPAVHKASEEPASAVHSSPAAPTYAVHTAPVEEPTPVVNSAPAAQPAPAFTAPAAEHAPVREMPQRQTAIPTQTFETGVPESVNAYTSYNTTKTTYTAPIESIDFGTPSGDGAEDVAILIGQKIARNNPAYARSANEMRTFTKVTASPGEDIFAPSPAPAVAPSVAPAPTPAPQYNEVAKTAAMPVSEPQVITFGDEADASPAASFEFVEEPRRADAPQAVYNGEKTEYDKNYEYAAILAGFNGQSRPEPQPEVQPEPQFKPYTPPSASDIQPQPVREESTLRVERSMLSPTPEEIYQPKEEVASEPEYTPATVEPQPATMAAADPTPEYTVVEDEFAFAEEVSKDEHEEAEDMVWTPDEEPTEEYDTDEDEDIPGEEDVEADVAADEAEDDDFEDEIPPEEQNPDVKKYREMFPFLNPIGEKQPAEAEEDIDVEDEEDDEPPFDEPVRVNNPAPAAKVNSALNGLVAVDEPKSEPKKKKPDYSDYVFPPIELLSLEESTYDENIQAEIQENADKLVDTLSSFGVTASIKGVDRGPRITRYEVVPAKGVKVSSILNLQDDIALNLAAGSIRMEAPIPGKSAVGIEIPNKKSSIVRLRNLLETEDFKSNKSKTVVCIGRDVSGQPVFGDISKMPHLLIAGATGMGKSVCINSLLISVLYKARPDEVKLIMIDPKQVEFTMYNGIPHLLVPVVSDPKQAAGALMWAVEEMERRYNLLNPLCVRNIDGYNEKVTADPSLGEPMPRIIIVIDEFADLMLQVKDPVEHLVMRIAQKARAAGIYLVIGTQRPSVNVITGVIKANVPSRISCKVMSNVDSKTVLDSAGAEKLLDRGDALYAPAGSPKPHRVQCAFVSDNEVEAIMAHLRKFSDGESYDSTVMEEIDRAAQKCSKKGGGNDRDDDDDRGSGDGYYNDPQFLDAVEVAVNTRKISTSLLQRKLSIGYAKAAKFIDIMEEIGVVGESNGSRPREVLLTPDEWREKLARVAYE